jgi:hypothetical protein
MKKYIFIVYMNISDMDNGRETAQKRALDDRTYPG